MSETLNLDDVRVVSLVSGRTIIGFQIASSMEELSENPELDSFIVLQYPYEIDCQLKEEQDSFDLNLFKFMPYLLDDSFLVRKSNIEILGSPDEHMIECYSTLISSQIYGFHHDPDLDN